MLNNEENDDQARDVTPDELQTYACVRRPDQRDAIPDYEYPEDDADRLPDNGAARSPSG